MNSLMARPAGVVQAGVGRLQTGLQQGLVDDDRLGGGVGPVDLEGKHARVDAGLGYVEGLEVGALGLGGATLPTHEHEEADADDHEDEDEHHDDDDDRARLRPEAGRATCARLVGRPFVLTVFSCMSGLSMISTGGGCAVAPPT